MNNFKLLISLSFLFLLLACTKKRTTKPSVKTIIPDIENINNEAISSRIKSLDKVIVLETKPECLISKIDKIEVCGNFIYILDIELKTVFIFSQDGNFLYKIHNIGKGPGEFLSITDMTVNKNEVTIIDILTQKKINYDTTGKLKNELRVFNEIWAMNIFYLNDELFYLNDYSKSNSGRYRLFCINEEKKIDTFLSFDEEPDAILTDGYKYSTIRDKASLIFTGCDTIFTIKNKVASPLLVVSQQAGDKKKFKISSINETDKELFLTLSRDQGDYVLIYNKNSGEYEIAKALTELLKYNGRKIHFKRIINQKLYQYVSADLFCRNYNINKNNKMTNIPLKQRVDKIMHNYNSDSNPVVFVYDIQ
ncbi:6-bladed beta-propeller [Prolixibacteraceae bacterium JC049]|nr:6-bladed beta-propeller [Prolixibacteraceae bacterium JC049]